MHICVYRYTDVGKSRHVRTLLNHLVGQGIRVTLVCAEGAVDAPIDGLDAGVAVRRLGLSTHPAGRGAALALQDHWAAGQGLRRVLREPFDVLYVIDSWSLASAFVATSGRFRVGRARTVYHTFDWLEPGLVHPAHVWLERRICRQADQVVNVDRSRARLQRTLYRLRRTPLVVPNYVSIRDPSAPADPAVRAQLLGGVPRGDEILLVYPTTAGDLASAQRLFHELIEAHRHLPDRHRLCLYYRDGEEYRRCRQAVADWGLDGRVRFMDPVPFPTLQRHLAVANIGAVLYDDSRSSGYFMCNADKLAVLVAAGLPFVASDFPGLEGLTYRYGLGLCCDARKPEELAAAIRQLADGLPSLVDRRQAVRRAFEQDLHFERRAPELVQMLHSLVEGA